MSATSSGVGSLSESIRNGCRLSSAVLRNCGDDRIPLGMPDPQGGLLASCHVTMTECVGALSVSGDPHRKQRLRSPSALQILSVVRRIRMTVGTESIHFGPSGGTERCRISPSKITESSATWRPVAPLGMKGSIDWYCYPHFDSPSIFGAILDDEEGGSCTLPSE